jgi:DNA-binding NarL/FixJ family response regulator
MLIVEDQDYMRRMLHEFVQSAFPEARVMAAADGSSALALCRDCRPSVVLMDIELPDANGIELTAEVKAMLPDTAVIIVSSHSGRAYMDRAKMAGAFAYVAKDTAYQDLLPAVKSALAQMESENHQRDSQ